MVADNDEVLVAALSALKEYTMRSFQPKLTYSLLTCGLVLVLLGFGGSWGSAYGQTAGPTPTPGTITSPITIVKSVNPTSGAPGDLITFSVQLRNNDAVPRTNAVIQDRILDFLEIVSVTSTKGTVTINGQDIRVEVGTLAPGETVTVTITVRIRATAQSGDTGINVATGTTTGGDGTTSETSSNPVAISVGQAPPSGLPNTGDAGQPNGWLLGFGVGLLLLGTTLLLARRRLSPHDNSH